MVLFVLQLMVVCVWAATMTVHTRRLLRLACVEQLRRWEGLRVRSSLNRIWWWLGQDEFWRGVQKDTQHAVEVTLMIFLIAWGVA